MNNARLIRNSVIGTTEFLLQSESLSPLEQNVKVNLRIWFNPGRKESLFVVPGVYALVLAAYPALLSAIAMVREKEQGTIMQVYASKATAAQFLGGKAVAYLVVGCLESVFIMLSGFVIFGIYPISDPVFLTLGTLLFLINSVFLGLWMGSSCDTQLEAVQLVALLAFMTTLLFSGFMYPLSTVPFPLSLLSYLVPARYYIEIARAAFVRGTGIEGLWYAPMALSCLALLLVFASWASIRTMRLRD